MPAPQDTELIEQWKASVEEFSVNDIRKCLHHDIIEVGLVILTLSAIESISGYFCGKRANKDTFVEFLKSRYFPQEYNTVADQLYPLRNGLFHDYATDKNSFILFRTRGQGLEHLQASQTQHGPTIAVNREILATDFLAAWTQFSSDTTQHDDIATRVLTRIRDTDRGFLVVRDVVAYPTSPPWQSDLNPHSGSPINPSTPSTYTGGTISYRPSPVDNQGGR